MPRPDFPISLSDFIRRFSTEKACWQYLVDSRWPDGWSCPVCGERKGYLITTRKVFKCIKGHQGSATAGTVMHRTKLPLSTWFQAAFMVTTHTPGLSALQLSRQLDLRFETAYMVLQKLRAGMVKPEREKLKGIVEVDEAYIGGRKSGGKQGRGAAGKAVVAAAAEVRGEKLGRIRLVQVPDVGKASLQGFIETNVERKSTVITDGWIGYDGIHRKGYRHELVEGQTDVEIARGLKHVHLVFSNLKTWILGTHHGRIEAKHLQAYLNEFVFRFNRRQTPMAAFQTVLGIGSQIPGPTYEGIYEGTWKHPNPAETGRSG